MEQVDKGLVVREAQAIRYLKPAVTRSGVSFKQSSALVLVDVKPNDGSPEVFRGIGEAQFRGVETGDKGNESWEFLSRAIEYLVDQPIDVSTNKAALKSIEKIMLQLKAMTGTHHDVQQKLNVPSIALKDRIKLLVKGEQRIYVDQLEEETLPENRFRGALFGIETALLDAVAKAVGQPLAQLLSGTATLQDVLNVEVHQVHQIQSNLRIDVLSQIQDLAQTTSADTPIWMDFDRRFGSEVSTKWVQRLHARANNGLFNQIVLYRPLRREDEAAYPNLVKDATKRAEGARPYVVIASDPLSDQTTLDNEISDAHLRVVRPASVGSLIQARKLLEQYGPNAVLVGEENATGVAAAALQHLAGSLAISPAVVLADKNLALVHAAGNGLCIDVPWLELVTAEGVRTFSTSPLQEKGALKFNTYRELPYLQTLGPNGTKGHLMEREALSLGMDTVRYSKGAFTASDRKHDPLVFKWSRSPLSSAVSLAICTHKEATRMRLGQAGIPVPRGRTFRNGDFQTAREFAELIGFPVVVKPAMGVRGIGVVAGIADHEELDMAFKQLSDSKLGDQDFIVEKHVHGKDYRIVVVGDKVIAAILREPASVVGDGVRPIGELILRKNAQRRLNPHLWGRPIIFDAAAEFQLQKVNLTLDSVPENGRVVMLSNSSSLSQGGDSIDVLDELHPSIIEASVKAVKAIPDLAFCGVDFLIEDHTKPLSEQEAGICELNAHAAIGNCEYPLYGQPRQVAKAFMDLCVDRYGLQVSAERAARISVKIKVRGRVTGVGYRAWFAKLATQYGLDGWVRNAGTRTVEAVISGETYAVTALVASAVLGPRRANPTSVTTIHVPAPRDKGFSIIAKKPKEKASV